MGLSGSGRIGWKPVLRRHASGRPGCAISAIRQLTPRTSGVRPRKPPFPHDRSAIYYCVLDAAPIGPCCFVLVFSRLLLDEDGMHRRRFIALLGTTITSARTLRAQQKATAVIGWLNPHAPPANRGDLAQIHQALSETGFVEGQNMASEYRWAEDHFDRLPALAADLVSRKVDLIITGDGAAAALA